MLSVERSGPRTLLETHTKKDLNMSLPGKSKTITVEPLKVPVTPLPVKEPVKAPVEPEREKVPA